MAATATTAEMEPEVNWDGLLTEAMAWSSAHGLAYGIKADDAHSVHAPLTLLPTRVPRARFVQAKKVAPLLNLLVDRIARDEEWLVETLQGVLAGDDFTRRLVEVFLEVRKQPMEQSVYLGIHRSDYMLDMPREEGGEHRMLQVELNTIASSFGCLSDKVSQLHRFLLLRFGESHGLLQWFVTKYPELGSVADLLKEITEKEAGENSEKEGLAARLPINGALQGTPNALAVAAKVYIDQQGDSGSTPRPLIVFVVQEGETNSFDQRWLEYELWDAHGVACVRKTLAELHAQGELRTVSTNPATNNGKSSRQAFFVDGKEVAVVYFRAGYTPEDYHSEDEWTARALVERSAAIKCPSIAYHLVGAKKVQQKLALPGVVERFIPGESDSKLIRECFAGLWTLDMQEDVSGVAAEERAKAIAKPEGYVLKPQREGGGNNYYGAQITEQLNKLSTEEQASFILMERIFPEAQDTVLAKVGAVTRGKGISELGIFGQFIGGVPGGADGNDGVLLNEARGHLVRTKLVGVDEGGVASGFSCLDSPFML